MGTLIVLIVTIVSLAGLAWVISQAMRQQSDIAAKVTALSSQLATPLTASRERNEVLDALKGDRAPGFSLVDLNGANVTLKSLLAPEKPLLLIFAEPRCGPCYELLPDIAGWQRLYGDRLTIALLSTGTRQNNLAMTAEYGIETVLLQNEVEVVHAYNLIQAPAGVLIQGDGRVVAGPRYGARAIRQLVADTLGLALPAHPTHEEQAIGVGSPAPAIRLPDLDGNVIDLRAYQGTPLMLLFWSPGCSHCADLLPDALAYERHESRLPVLVVSRGPLRLNQDLGFRSPVILDEDQSICRTLGAVGTPGAILIDGNGMVAAPLIRGTVGVRELLARAYTPARSVAD